jgi:lipid-binding SYLF domain-containing protein
MTLKSLHRTSLIALALACLLAVPAFAKGDAEEADSTILAARATLADFMADPDMTWFKEHFREAKAVLIVPNQNKGGFIFAGSGGVGVLLAKDAKGGWGSPAFYRLASVSVGFQIGGEHSQVIFLVESQKGVDSFLSSKVQLGGDLSVAAGPVGQGTQATTADVLSFSRSKGAFVGASLEGTMVKPASDLNRALYGKAVSPVDILVRDNVPQGKAEALREDLAKASRKG